MTTDLDRDALERRLGPRAHPRGVIRYGGTLASRGFRLTAFLISISQLGQREAFLADEAGTMARFGLDEREQALVRTRDYAGLLQAGAHVYAVAKSGHAFGATLMDIGARLRGQSTAELVSYCQARRAAMHEKP
jgi:protocatechuate 4,5-dioxygenase alpha chain